MSQGHLMAKYEAKVCVFSTMRGVSPTMLRSFISWHLHVGFDAIIVFWDFEKGNEEEIATCHVWDALLAGEYQGRLHCRLTKRALAPLTCSPSFPSSISTCSDSGRIHVSSLDMELPLKQNGTSTKLLIMYITQLFELSCTQKHNQAARSIKKS
jgi:hypothetical protein